MTAASFKKKKIKPQKTLGDILKLRRKRKNLSLEEVEEATHIRLRFLEAIENENWENMPLDIYTRGYVECYAQFLGFEKNQLLTLFDKERHLYRHLNSSLTAQKSNKPLTTMWLFTPKMLLITIGILFFTSLAGYISFQISTFSSVPELKIITPAKGSLVIQSDTVKLIGKTSPDAKIKINGQPISVDYNGQFQEELGLTEGENTFVVTATGRNKKTNAELITIEADL